MMIKGTGLVEEDQGRRYKTICLGLNTYMIFEYIRFGVWLPTIGAFHPQRIVAIVTLVGFLLLYKDRVEHPHALIWFLTIIVFSTLVNLGNLSRARALFFFLTIVKITAIYYLISNLLINSYSLKNFLIVFISVNLVLIFTGILVGGEKGALSYGVFAEGFVSDSNDFALAVNVVIPFFFYLFMNAERKLLKAFFCAGFALCVIVVIYTFSRGGFIGLCILLLYMLTVSKGKLRNIILILALVFIVYKIAPSIYWEKMETILSYKSADPRSTSQIRLKLWKIGIIMTLKNPFFGVGPLNYPYQIGKYGRSVEPDLDELAYLGGFLTHNTFINVSAELGITGLCAFLALVFLGYRNSSIAKRKLDRMGQEKAFWLVALPQAIKASLVAYCATSFFLTSYLYPHIYILGALSLATRRFVEKM